MFWFFSTTSLLNDIFNGYVALALAMGFLPTLGLILSIAFLPSAINDLDDEEFVEYAQGIFFGFWILFSLPVIPLLWAASFILALTIFIRNLYDSVRLLIRRNQELEKEVDWRK